MKTEKYRATGKGIDADYQYYAGKEHLFTVAFFGHGKRNPEETARAKRKLNYIWKSLVKQYGKGHKHEWVMAGNRSGSDMWEVCDTCGKIKR